MEKPDIAAPTTDDPPLRRRPPMMKLQGLTTAARRAAQYALTITSGEGAKPLLFRFRRIVTGAKGTLVLTGDATVNLADPAAAEVEGTWRVESATDAYSGHAGGGTITGNADFTLPQPRETVRYAGHLVAEG
jgi:hypothetical protein